MGTNRTSYTDRLEELAPEISDLVGFLDRRQLERVTVNAIVEHRRLLALAEDAYQRVKDQETAAPEQHEVYVVSMLHSKAQMTVVAALIDRLGYVPDVPDDH